MNISLSIVILLADQFIKAWIRRYPIGFCVLSLSPLVEIRRCTNTGAAFSILHGNTLIIAVFSIILILAISIYIKRNMCLTPPAEALLACLLGGGVGNLIDRLLFGGVTDYIQLLFIDFPVFNLADIAITLSVLILMLLLISGNLEEEYRR